MVCARRAACGANEARSGPANSLATSPVINLLVLHAMLAQQMGSFQLCAAVGATSCIIQQMKSSCGCCKDMADNIVGTQCAQCCCSTSAQSGRGVHHLPGSRHMPTWPAAKHMKKYNCEHPPLLRQSNTEHTLLCTARRRCCLMSGGLTNQLQFASGSLII